MTRNITNLVTLILAGAVLTACATEAPPPVSEAPVVEEEAVEVPEEPVFEPTPGLSDRDRFRKAIAMLEVGNVGQAKAELDAYIEAVPNSSMAQGLVDQIETPIEEYFPAESFVVTLATGDSLSTLAKEYLGDALQFYALARFNGIDNPSQVTVGQAIKIPATEGALAARDKPKEEEAPVAEAPVDEVQQDAMDSLSGWEKVNEAERVGDYATAVETLNAMSLTDPAEAAAASDIYMTHARAIAETDSAGAARNAMQAGALLLNVANNPADAMKALSWATQTDPTLTDAQELLASAQATVVDQEYRAGLEAYNKQDLDGAINHWNNVLMINPDHTNAQLYKNQAEELKAKLSNM